MEIFTAWVTTMFTIRKIDYTVAMAFVTIMVEVWWLRSAESGFLMYSVRGDSRSISCEIFVISVDFDVLPPQHLFELL